MSEKTNNPDYLPTGINECRELSLPDEIAHDASLDELKKIANQHINNALKGIYAGWGNVKSIQGICKLATTTAELVEKQRKLLLQPASYSEYLAGKSGGKKKFGLETLE